MTIIEEIKFVSCFRFDVVVNANLIKWSLSSSFYLLGHDYHVGIFLIRISVYIVKMLLNAHEETCFIPYFITFILETRRLFLQIQ